MVGLLSVAQPGGEGDDVWQSKVSGGRVPWEERELAGRGTRRYKRCGLQVVGVGGNAAEYQVFGAAETNSDQLGTGCGHVMGPFARETDREAGESEAGRDRGRGRHRAPAGDKGANAWQ